MIVSKNADVEGVAITSVEGLPVKGPATLKPLMSGDHMIMLELTLPAGSGTALHTHQHESICYVVKGTVKFVVEDETYTLSAGDSCRHPKDVPHSVAALEDATIIEIKSPTQPLEQFLGTS